MKLQAPVLFTVVVPSLVPVALRTVTVELPAAVPFSVTESLEFTAMLVMMGAAGRGARRICGWHRHIERARFYARPRRGRIGGGECVGASFQGSPEGEPKLA